MPIQHSPVEFNIVAFPYLFTKFIEDNRDQSKNNGYEGKHRNSSFIAKGVNNNSTNNSKLLRTINLKIALTIIIIINTV